MKKFLAPGLILILSASLVFTCKKDNGAPPTLPPQESFTVDFTNFLALKKGADAALGQKGINNSSWEFASGLARDWYAVINAAIAVPVTSFKLAIDQDPVFLSAKTWEWSYNAFLVGVTYKARLTGQTSGTDILWKMYITREGTGGFAEFLWFTGTSKTDGTGGQWIINRSPQEPDAYLQVDWTKTGSSVGSVKYTNVKNLDAQKTSFIEYGLKSTPLNAYYTIHYYNTPLAKFSEVNVEWNTTTKNGRVKGSDFLGGLWFCWDENKVNNTVNCPQ